MGARWYGVPLSVLKSISVCAIRPLLCSAEEMLPTAVSSAPTCSTEGERTSLVRVVTSWHPPERVVRAEQMAQIWPIAMSACALVRAETGRGKHGHEDSAVGAGLGASVTIAA